jgi:hypothetical protein
MRTIFDILNDVYAKHYGPTEHFAGTEITLLFKHYIPKKYKVWNKN